MNIWTKKSIDLANQRDYLDQLYKVYPMSNNLKRDLELKAIEKIEQCYLSQDNKGLINILIQQELFPIKDSYVSYLKRDKTAIERNPKTINRLSGILYSMNFNEIIEKMTLPKETNRQIGPLFKNWLKLNPLGVKSTDSIKDFMSNNNDMVFNSSDKIMQDFATKYLGYHREKGLDFIARFNDNYILGEAKFLTDFGGHQNSQLNDAIDTMRSTLVPSKYKVIKIAILDGVVYINGNHKMMKTISTAKEDEIIISSLLLRDYLYSL